MRTVHLRVNDAATGRPTPVRLRVAGPDGRALPPLGRPAEFPTGPGEAVGGQLLLGRDAWWPIDGSCELSLPVGVPLTVEAAKGPEYRPLRETLTLTPGQLTVRLAVERLAEPAARGWFAGDGRALAVAPHDARLEGAAEGLAAVNLLAGVVEWPSPRDGRTYPAVPHLAAFSGQSPCLPAGEYGCEVVVNTYNTHPVLGRLALWNTHRPVFPLAFGGPDPDDWSLADWSAQARRKGGLAVWAEPDLDRGEALACALLGKLDALELTPAAAQPALRAWTHLAAAGVRLPLVGASGKDSNRTPLGAMRTYARLPAGEPFTYAGWVAAVKAGRTYATTGPLLTFAADDAGPGEVLDRPPGALVRLTASAASAHPFARLQLLAGTAVVAEASADASLRAEVTAEYRVERPGWLTARCLGAGPGPGGAVPFAQATPVWLEVAGRAMTPDPAAAAALATALDRAREWAETAGRYDDPRNRDRLLKLLDDARAVLAGAGP